MISHILNEDQLNAVSKTLTCTNYSLIQGFPGTGKTETITSIVQMIVNQGLSVIISSHTNSAVDNVLLKLIKKDIKFLRIGRSNRVNNELKNFCDAEVTKDCSSIDELEALYNSYVTYILIAYYYSAAINITLIFFSECFWSYLP